MIRFIKSNTEYIIYSFFLFLYYVLCFQKWDGTYIDTDNYFHIMKTIDFIKSPSLTDGILQVTNYPIGEVWHWTRFFDIFMLLVSLPFLCFFSVKDAVFYSAFWINPILLFLTFSVLFFFFKKNIDAKSRFLAFILLFVQANFMRVFIVNRPDHHSMIMCLLALILINLFNVLNKGTKKYALYLSLCCSLALWLSPECFLMYVGCLLCLFISYLFFNFDYIKLIYFTSYSSLFITLFWIINPPYEGYFALLTGRLSFFYVITFCYVALVLYIAKYIKRKIHRLLFLIFTALILLIWGYNAGVMNSPFNDLLNDVYLDRVTEIKSGLSIYYLSYPLISLILLFLLLKSNYSNAWYWTLFIFFTIYLIVSIKAMRFLPYMILISTLIIVQYLYEKNISIKKFLAMILLLCSVEYISFSAQILFIQKDNKQNNALIPIYYLKKLNLPEGSVVTDLFLTPFVIWYANRPTIASSFHGNIEGIIDNHQILFSSDEKEVVDLIKKHRVGSILLPLIENDDFYVNPENNCDKLYAKISKCNNYPKWLRKIHDKNFYLYEVIKEKLDESFEE